VRHNGASIKKLNGTIKKSLEKQFKNWKAISETFFKIDGKEAYLLEAGFTFRGKNNTDVKMRNFQYFINNTETAYVLTFTMLQDDVEKFRKAIEESARSVQID
jgi:hypothetical protein